MNDLLFSEPRELDEAAIFAKARSLGLDGRLFAECLSGSGLAEITQQNQAAEKLGITTTPSFFIGTISGNSVKVTQRLAGAQPFDKFALELDKALASAR